MRLDGKVAIITGAGSGMGAATAKLFASEGAAVVVADTSDEGGNSTVAEITEAGGRAQFVHTDVTDESAWERLIAATDEAFGQLDILVNNAGISGSAYADTTSTEGWRTIMGVNVDGVFLGTKHAIPIMTRGGGGSIVNISSVAGLRASSHAAAYGASKGGVRQYSKSVAQHCARRGYGIRCNSIHPGSIETPMGQHAMSGVAATLDEGRERYKKGIPLKAIGEPDDIAYAALYLACGESKYVTGQELTVDGGVMMG